MTWVQSKVLSNFKENISQLPSFRICIQMYVLAELTHKQINTCFSRFNHWPFAHTLMLVSDCLSLICEFHDSLHVNLNTQTFLQFLTDIISPLQPLQARKPLGWALNSSQFGFKFQLPLNSLWISHLYTGYCAEQSRLEEIRSENPLNIVPDT